MSEADPATADGWARLRQLTPARIALGRVGTSLPTAAHLAFQLAHAQARDAVHLELDPAPLQQALRRSGCASLSLHSAAGDRRIYLQRPDLGRCLDHASATELRGLAAVHGRGADLAVVIADGLSALAVHRHALPMFERLRALAAAQDWSLAPVCLVAHARVAVGDAIGELLGARLVVVMIGERPGLSSPDSLGLYLTHAPRVGTTDAERNCISNIRHAGLSYEQAARTLGYLLREAFRRRLSGVRLKDQAEAGLAAPGEPPAPPGRHFLVPE